MSVIFDPKQTLNVQSTKPFKQEHLVFKKFLYVFRKQKY